MRERKKENILYSMFQALHLIYQGDPPIVWFIFAKNIIEAVFDAICGVYFIKYIYECIENQVDFHKLFVMVSVVCTFHIIVHLISAYNSYLEKISTMKIYRYIFQKIIHRAKKIEISQYEDPKFYDSFSRAMDEALEQGMGGLFLTAWGVGCVFRAITAMAILVTVDAALIFFVIPPLLRSLYLGLKESAEEFAARREETVGKRKMEYAKRVFYEKKYAGKLCIYMKSINEFLECPIEKAVEHAVLPRGDMGEIFFKNVSYHYAGSEQMIIKNLNLRVRKGEHIALVGENGAGKTTLMKLLMGLYPVSGGSITVGGEDIGRYEPEAYRDQFGTVFQDFQIFSLPLCENVLMKAPETEEERQLVVDSLEKAQFGEMLKKMPNGIDTFLTKEFDENGFVCSGGQAQKIAIARVFAKNPQVVILDEPSSALDPIAEYNMYCNMMEAAKGKTVFFISHRMSSARMADRILFLEDGHIIEEGSHDELMEKNGRYAEMFHLQARNYQEKNGGEMYAG